MQAILVLFIPAFQAQESSITKTETSLLMSSTSYSSEGSCLRARRTCKFRWQPWVLPSLSPEGPPCHCAAGKAWAIPLQLPPRDHWQPTLPLQGWGKGYKGTDSTCVLAVLLSCRLSYPSSLPQRRTFRKLNLFTAQIYSLIPWGVVQYVWGAGQLWERPWWERKAGTSSTGLTTSWNIMGNHILKVV